MTSKKVMLTAMVLLVGGCGLKPKPKAEPLISPYGTPQVWAVLPLSNESGSLQADGVMMADQLAHQLEGATHIDVLPVNRAIEAQEALAIQRLGGARDATRLLDALNADALVVGTVTAYDPYDPPKLGMALQLFVRPRRDEPLEPAVNVRDLTRAATDGKANPSPRPSIASASVVSAFYDAADPAVRAELKRYAYTRGSPDLPSTQGVVDRVIDPRDDDEWRRYRISMDLYSEFVSYAMSKRLLQAETRRLAAAPTP